MLARANLEPHEGAIRCETRTQIVRVDVLKLQCTQQVSSAQQEAAQRFAVGQQVHAGHGRREGPVRRRRVAPLGVVQLVRQEPQVGGHGANRLCVRIDKVHFRGVVLQKEHMESVSSGAHAPAFEHLILRHENLRAACQPQRTIPARGEQVHPVVAVAHCGSQRADGPWAHRVSAMPAIAVGVRPLFRGLFVGVRQCLLVDRTPKEQRLTQLAPA
eukprot:6187635-Pleurochrysis_carterae.AAC.1